MSFSVIQTIMGMIGSVGFAVLFGVRGRKLAVIALGSGAGWAVYLVCRAMGCSISVSYTHLDVYKRQEQWEKAGVALPAYDIAAVAEETKKSPVWVHFGAGNIFRIFIGGIADTLIANGEASKGITCVETFDFDVVDKIYAP